MFARQIGVRSVLVKDRQMMPVWSTTSEATLRSASASTLVLAC